MASAIQHLSRNQSPSSHYKTVECQGPLWCCYCPAVTVTWNRPLAFLQAQSLPVGQCTGLPWTGNPVPQPGVARGSTVNVPRTQDSVPPAACCCCSLLYLHPGAFRPGAQIPLAYCWWCRNSKYHEVLKVLTLRRCLCLAFEFHLFRIVKTVSILQGQLCPYNINKIHWKPFMTGAVSSYLHSVPGSSLKSGSL